MALLDGSSIAAKFSPFWILQTDYKKIGNHGIQANFLIPKKSYTGKRPVMINFHGGCLVR
jgi:cephalosporin-C deacetylase-like acetyl esterase